MAEGEQTREFAIDATEDHHVVVDFRGVQLSYLKLTLPQAHALAEALLDKIIEIGENRLIVVPRMPGG